MTNPLEAAFGVAAALALVFGVSPSALAQQPSSQLLVEAPAVEVAPSGAASPFWAGGTTTPTRASTPSAAVTTTSRQPPELTPPPPTAVPERGPDIGWVVTGAIVLGVGYLGALPWIIGGLANTSPCLNDAGAISLVPIVGPLVGHVHADSCLGHFEPTPAWRASTELWPASLAPTLVQALGLGTLIAGLAANVPTGNYQVQAWRLIPGAARADVGFTFDLRF